mmetsp:Transcript_32508/g.37867  ORF Transcript_32508/g.37867 Transcript_32508/m.37867 type:complete len:90 (+) Transcript_32508:230-499(+)
MFSAGRVPSPCDQYCYFSSYYSGLRQQKYVLSNFTLQRLGYIFHGFDITHNSETYAFLYDDVFEQSFTIQANYPRDIRITVGGFVNIQG